MTTYSWTLGTDFTGAWNSSASDWTPGGFPANGNNYATDNITIIAATNLSLSGFGTSETMNSLYLDDPNGVFTFTQGGNINVTTGLTLNSGQIVATGGALNIGGGANDGVVTINGTLVGGSDGNGDPLDFAGAGNSSASLEGTGTVLAQAGLTLFQSINVTDTSALSFDVENTGDGATQSQLYFANDVDSGTVDFVGGSGLLVLAGTQVSSNGATLSGGTFGATIDGLTAGTGFTNGIDLLALSGASAASADLSGVNNTTLTVWDTATPGVGDSFTFNLAGNYTGDTAVVQTDTAYGGFDVFLSSVCFGAGTSVLTDAGEMAIESIQAGDTVMTVVDGTCVPQTVKWVGYRELVLGHHPNPDAISPVRILKGALGENLPRRDLLLSPDHCLFIDGGLIPAKLLVNDMTIVRDLTLKTVSYHHIELEQHGIMIAEGVEAETYLDTGNRAFFSNAGLATLLHPELTINENLRCWEDDACAPLLVKPEVVKPVWQRFVDRALGLGHVQPEYETTTDAAIHLMVDGKAIRPVGTQGQKVSFMVPADAHSVRLVSRSVRPGALTPWIDDQRTLGVAIRTISLRNRAGETVLGADHRALKGGWHVAERAADGTMWRWSNGNAALPIVSDGPCTVEITLSETSIYLESADRLAA